MAQMTPAPMGPPSSVPRRSPRRSPRNHRAPSAQPTPGPGSAGGSQGQAPSQPMATPMDSPLDLFSPHEKQTPVPARRTPGSFRGTTRPDDDEFGARALRRAKAIRARKSRATNALLPR